MNPALELARLLGSRNSTQVMIVVESSPSMVRVSSRIGPVELKNDGSIYNPGDALVVRDSVILGRAVKESDVAVYYL